MCLDVLASIAFGFMSTQSLGLHPVDNPFRKNYSGVWASSRGQILAIPAHSDSQFRINDIECVLGAMQDTPSGDFFGEWKGDKTMFLAKLATKGSHSVYRYVPGFGTTAYGGEIRITPIADALVDQPRTFQLKLSHSRKALTVADFTDHYSYLCNFTRVSFEGQFSDAHYLLALEKSSNGTQYSGKFSYNGKTWVLKGDRVGLRMGFGLYDYSHGATVGQGYVEWTPSVQAVHAMFRAADAGTDQLYISVELPKVLPTGHHGFLLRSQ